MFSFTYECPASPNFLWHWRPIRVLQFWKNSILRGKQFQGKVYGETKRHIELRKTFVFQKSWCQQHKKPWKDNLFFGGHQEWSFGSFTVIYINWIFTLEECYFYPNNTIKMCPYGTFSIFYSWIQLYIIKYYTILK